MLNENQIFVENRIYRLPEVCSLTGYSSKSIYRKQKDGTFPKSIKLGGRAIGFLAEDLQAWLEERIKESKPAQEVNHD